MQQSISGQRRRSVLKREGGGGGGDGLIFHSAIRIDPSDVPKCPLILCCSLAQANFFAIFTVSGVSVIDLWQCISRQLFRQSCFMVASSWVVWEQKMCALKSPMSKVLSNSSLSGFFGNQKVWGGALPTFCPCPLPPPLLRRLCLWQINVKRRLIWLFFFYIKFCWRPATCFVARMLNVMFLYSRTIYILALLQTCLTYVFCCGTLLIYIGNHKI